MQRDDSASTTRRPPFPDDPSLVRIAYRADGSDAVNAPAFDFEFADVVSYLEAESRDPWWEGFGAPRDLPPYSPGIYRRCPPRVLIDFLHAQRSATSPRVLLDTSDATCSGILWSLVPQNRFHSAFCPACQATHPRAALIPDLYRHAYPRDSIAGLDGWRCPAGHSLLPPQD